MSLHAVISREALAKLNAQRRRTRAASIGVALLVIILLALVLALWNLAVVSREVSPVVTYQPPTARETEEPVAKPELSRAKPSAAPSSSFRPIVSQVAAPVALPVPDEFAEAPALEFGAGDDFMDGFVGDGAGSGTGNGSKFGSLARIGGALTGRLFDFKQTPDREPNDDYLGDRDSLASGRAYAEIVETLHRRDFSDAAFRDFYQAPNELSLTHLAIPLSPASEGPRYFGAEKEMQPAGWAAHYRGVIRAPESGRYRFAGLADDYMAVVLDGKPRLIASWPSLQPLVVGRWDAAEESGRWKSPLAGKALIFGDWVKLEAGQEIQLDLGIGERPGGHVGFLLLVEKQGETYRKAADGRPILPLFTTAPFTAETRAEIAADFPDFEFEWERVPVFPAR